MTELVDKSEIEVKVGIARHATQHYARAVSSEKMMYILHSEHCLSKRTDLRKCPYSRALDQDLYAPYWADYQDIPVAVKILRGYLVPTSLF